MRRFIIGPPYPTGREAGDGAASVISPAHRMMPAQTSRPRPSGPTCTCLPRQSTLAPTAALESPRATEAVAPRASRAQVGHRLRVAEQVFVDPGVALADALDVPNPQSWRPDVPFRSPPRTRTCRSGAPGCAQLVMFGARVRCAGVDLRCENLGHGAERTSGGVSIGDTPDRRPRRRSTGRLPSGGV